MRTILLIILIYLTFRVITRMLLPSASRNKKSSFFSQFDFTQNTRPGSNGDNQRTNHAKSNARDRKFSQIEEAEFEDITEEEKTSEKKSNA